MFDANQLDASFKQEVVTTNRQANLVRLLDAADAATNRNYLTTCSTRAVRALNDRMLDSGLTKSLEQMNLFKVVRLVYEANENPTEKLKTFFLSFSGMELKASIFYVIQNELVKYGKEEDGSDNEYATTLYLGVKPLGLEHSASDAQTVSEMFKEAFRGTFLGSEITEELPKESTSRAVSIEDVREKATGGNGSDVGIVCVSAQPSVRKDSDDKTVQQGLEHFIDVMRNREYTAVILATPVDQRTIELRKREIENFYSKLSLFQKVSVAFGENDSRAIGSNVSTSSTVTRTSGESLTKTESSSSTSGTSRSTSYGSSSSSSSSSPSGGSSSGSSYTESTSWSHSQTIGFSVASGTTHSLSDAQGETSGSSDTKTSGSSITHTVEAQNKGVVDLLARLDESLKKIRKSETFGLWECAGYFISQRMTEASFAANTFKALVLGEESEGEQSHTISWPPPRTREERNRQQNLLGNILSGEHPILESHHGVYDRIIPTSLVNGRDLAYFMCLPHKSVPGLPVDSIAPFERSVAIKGSKRVSSHPMMVTLGRVRHMDMAESHVKLDLNDFTMHCFITGSTGSGKSNTTELLLQRCIENNINFLVVEPAKGEYKKSFKNASGIKVFSTHPLCERLLHVNPFRFDPSIHVLEHVDRLLNIFSSCWELTAAMPAILKKGVEQAYRVVGWDLGNSYFIGESKELRYPTFSTLTRELRKVIESSGYSSEAKGNYTGALVTRVESLTAGVLKQIFCSETNIPEEDLFDGKAIVDLSRLGSSETKTLIMGIMVMLLSEYRQVRSIGTNDRLRHIMVIEEAHNLLRNSVGIGNGGSDLVRKSVEMMSNAIAEMRTYGQGFMIVDQSPTAVDISAIKNTNTKIVMRLPEQQDCEAVANAMSLDEFQTKEVSKLPPGVAVVMQNGWTSAVLVNIAKSSPPAGSEEWTDPEYNRLLRTKLALLAAGQGKVAHAQIIDFLTKDVFENYEKVVGSLRMREVKERYGSDLAKYPEPSRATELKEMLDYYHKQAQAKLGKEDSKEEIYGRLIISLLGCSDIWEMFLDLPRIRRNADAFTNLISRFLLKPKDYAHYESDLEKLARCVSRAFLNGGIREAGGSAEDVAAFKVGVEMKDPFKGLLNKASGV